MTRTLHRPPLSCVAVNDNAGAVITGMTALSRFRSQTTPDAPNVQRLFHRQTTRHGCPVASWVSAWLRLMFFLPAAQGVGPDRGEMLAAGAGA